MEVAQNRTDGYMPTEAEIKAANQTPLPAQQQAWIDYRALNGLIFDAEQEASDGDFKMRKMPVGEFADKLGVSRRTLYDWQNSIPEFWVKVNARRAELAPQSRLAKLQEVWYLKALAMNDWRITDAWLRNFDPNYREPKQKVEHDIGSGMADLINAKRQQQIQQRNVIDVTPTDNPTTAV